MARMYYEKDVDLEVLKNKKVAVLGYGSQGHAHAQNLRDNGVHVMIGLYDGSKSAQKAKEDGFEVKSVAEATKESDLTMMLMPDEKQKKVYEESVKDNLKEGQTLAFAHGFNIHYNQVQPPEFVDVVMVAPKGPGHLVRNVFTKGSGVPALFAVYQDHTKKATETVLAYAKGIGATRAGVLETTFKEETETDLFGEQSVLCGGISELIKLGYKTLVDAGYQKEVAYFECLHEMKLIVDLIYEGGFERMRYSISDTAEYGDYVSGKRVITDAAKQGMQNVLEDIQNGKFAKAWIKENEEGRENFLKTREEEYNTEIAEVGRNLRSMMSFLK
ncbi:ketol-acid reductoisomerase [Clostridioides difficile]|uniref:Ketol-acid reductoisomerase (NADP(+)) n=6 Tax=Clostridioides difficile TaxID=1496 RepID=ILVC_CLOD6|nr:ketol-acid reductoisomerase [Clostridioides difficile]Q18C83.1 RecName: Full=Ketol-acid reductoisomerase (NADP(+)); Short=KARI; AltName: Full=Acetohydroxy-acid isomeroreductase; Short=AHIR; AltName: Full=Alpha-keto-beta-hydroxylacyl reductoisomerase; AltName: Full=Ketol-acid reductoisomerase type 1; AltName: Full=Ketol-acid reductoisomerase type I [Clostridioides difficile 630]EQE05439.1 ketol-acid reductoisomerase [Clostridioides difficile CD9]EQE10593.1 ketol-acid reductoisomerase [Clostrid